MASSESNSPESAPFILGKLLAFALAGASRRTRSNSPDPRIATLAHPGSDARAWLNQVQARLNPPW